MADLSISELLAERGLVHFRDPFNCAGKHIIMDFDTGSVIGRMDARAACEFLESLSAASGRAPTKGE